MKRHWGGGGGAGGALLLDSLEVQWPEDDSIDRLYRKLIDSDETALALPPLGSEPHLLSSRVRKHYLESVIRMLSLNYEHSQRLPGKNIRLPSAIWRCAKRIEAQAVQACMLMQLYRENILIAVKQLKTDTANCKLYRKLFECLNTPSLNDKSVQVNMELRPINGEPLLKKRRTLHTQRVYEKDLKSPVIARLISAEVAPDQIVESNNIEYIQSQSHNDQQYRIPVVVNVKCQSPLLIPQQHCSQTTGSNLQIYNNNTQPANCNLQYTNTSLQPNNTSVQLTHTNIQDTNTKTNLINNNIETTNTNAQRTTDTNGPFSTNVNAFNDDIIKCIENPQVQNVQNEPNLRLSIESQEAEDQVMLQMERLFQNDDEDDIFEGTFCGNMEYLTPTCDAIDSKEVEPPVIETQNCIQVVSENSAKSLDERIAFLNSAGALAPVVPAVHIVQRESPRLKKPSVSKWLCEDYYRRIFFHEKFDEICENNRKKYERLLKKFTALFNDDEEHQALSPQEETQEIILSCKERVGPFIVKNLMPYYTKGRIKSRRLFKDVAKHIIRGLIESNRFPDEYEVYTYTTDYFRVRPTIRCEADYMF